MSKFKLYLKRVGDLLEIPMCFYYTIYVAIIAFGVSFVAYTVKQKSKFSSTKLLFLGADCYLILLVLRSNVYFSMYQHGFIALVLFIMGTYFTI